MSAGPSDDEFFTVDRLARKLALSERTVRTLLDSGEIPSYRIRRQRRIDPVDVEAYLKRNRQAA